MNRGGFFVEIEYREKILEQNAMENEVQHDRRRSSEDCATHELDKEFEFKKKLHSTYEHLQQQVARSSTTLEQKRQLQEQIQLKIEQTRREIEQIQAKMNTEKKVGERCFDAIFECPLVFRRSININRICNVRMSLSINRKI